MNSHTDKTRPGEFVAENDSQRVEHVGLDFADCKRLGPRLPDGGVKDPRIPTEVQTEARFFTVEEVGKIIAAAREPYKTIAGDVEGAAGNLNLTGKAMQQAPADLACAPVGHLLAWHVRSGNSRLAM